MMQLRKDELYYLASPYSKYPDGHEKAFEDVARVAAELVRQGIHFFCPITHTHPIAEFGGLDPFDHRIWYPLDSMILHRCDALLVAMLPGWDESVGIAEETKLFANLLRPMYFVDPITFEVTTVRRGVVQNAT